MFICHTDRCSTALALCFSAGCKSEGERTTFRREPKAALRLPNGLVFNSVFPVSPLLTSHSPFPSPFVVISCQNNQTQISVGSWDAGLSLIRDVLWEVWNPRDIFCFPGGPCLFIWFPVLFLCKPHAIGDGFNLPFSPFSDETRPALFCFLMFLL